MRILRMDEGVTPGGAWVQLIDGEEVRPMQWHATKARSLAFYADTAVTDPIHNVTLHRYLALVRS